MSSKTISGGSNFDPVKYYYGNGFIYIVEYGVGRVLSTKEILLLDTTGMDISIKSIVTNIKRKYSIDKIIQ